jgi:uncharacterized protein
LPNESVFLFGPRGTGKSTWIRNVIPPKDALTVDLLRQSTFVELLGHSDRLEAMAMASRVKTIVIDEVQKLPELLDEVHRLIETRNWRFILTGSSARKLRRSGTNLLAGRARTLTMHPFTPSELATDFDWKHAMKYGLLPTVWTANDPEEYLAGYVGTYLREEVQQESMVRNLGDFRRFLSAASFAQGAVLNMQSVAADCGVSRKTVEGYFDLLEDLLLSVRLPVFTRKATRKLRSHPKFYYFDAGVFRGLRPRGPLDSDSEIDGAALETLLFEILRAENSNRRLGYEVFYWRTAEDVEVDFVLYGKHGLKVFEITRSNIFREKDLKGLQLFCSDYAAAQGYLLYAGTKRYKFDRIEVIPLAEAFCSIPDLLRP